MRGISARRRWTSWALLIVCAALIAACGRGDETLEEARDVTDSGSPADVIGRPEGADTIPPQMEDRRPEPPLPAESLPPSPPDDSLRRPERRPIRDIPPLTRPDSGRP